MPPKTQSIQVLHDQRPASSGSARMQREAEQARRFEQFRDFVRWLQERKEQQPIWDGETIILPLPPSMLNNSLAYAHWAIKSHRHNEYLGQIKTLGTLDLLPAPPKQAPEKARLQATFYVRRDNDQAGLMERCKWPVDWLVKAGWLKDDNQKHLAWAGVPTQVIVVKEPPRVEFQITSL